MSQTISPKRLAAALGATRQDRQRFWRRVAKTDGCWLWDRPSTAGYGWFWFDKIGFTAHHLAKLWETGPVEGKRFCRHKCANKHCVNPAHLEWGTHHQNMEDMGPNIVRNKGRQLYARGGNARLSREGAATLFAAYHHQGADLLTLAEAYDVHPETVRGILKRQHWVAATAGFDASQDRLVAKSRQAKGRLTEKEVLEILEAAHDGVMSKYEIAQAYGVSGPHVVMICQGKTWGSAVRKWREGKLHPPIP